MKKKEHLFWVLVTLFSIGCGSAQSAKSERHQASGKQSLTPVDLLNLPRIGESAISPGGDRLVFTKLTTDWKANRQTPDLWVVDSKGKSEARQVTFDEVRERAPQWQPSGDHISFVAKRADDEYRAVYGLPMSGGEAYKLFSFDADVKEYRWSSDSNKVYFVAQEPLAEDVKERFDTVQRLKPFERAQGFQRLWRANLKDSTIVAITPPKYHVTEFSVASDDSIAVFSKAAELQLDDKIDADIWSISLDSGKESRITNNNYAEKNIELSPDLKSVLFIADVNDKGEPYYDANLFVVSLASKDIKSVGDSHSFEVENAKWAADGGRIFIRANTGLRSELMSLSLQGQALTQITKGDHTFEAWHYDRLTNTHSYVLRSARSFGDLWVLGDQKTDLNGHPNPVRVTDYFDGFDQRFRLPETLEVHWQTEDGQKLEGLLSLPFGYRKGKSYPLVTHVHGGPKSSDQYGQLLRWRTYIPVLNELGYAYFTPNHRGGRGYGDAFKRDMLGGYFNNAHHDVLSGIDHLVDQGIADPDKLVIAGWSAGGHMVNKLITVTDRFKAASSGAGAVDWVSMYGETDVRRAREYWFGGSPWQQDAPVETYRKHSPISHLWKVKTPTIIHVGAKDVRVPPSQSKMLHRGLRHHGVDTELYIAPGEPHAYRELKHRLFKINADLDWFGEHVLQQKYEWQMAPE